MPVLIGLILAAAAAAGVALHLASRTRSIREFQDRQAHAIAEVASVVETSLAGTARALRLIAAVNASDAASLASMLEIAGRCTPRPCVNSIAAYRSDGGIERSVGRPVALDAQQVVDLADWARDPANDSRIHSTIARAGTPSLVLAARRQGGGFVAEEVPFDALFEPTRV
jgi:hypothetical protein